MVALAGACGDPKSAPIVAESIVGTWVQVYPAVGAIDTMILREDGRVEGSTAGLDDNGFPLQRWRIGSWLMPGGFCIGEAIPGAGAGTPRALCQGYQLQRDTLWLANLPAVVGYRVGPMRQDRSSGTSRAAQQAPKAVVPIGKVNATGPGYALSRVIGLVPTKSMSMVVLQARAERLLVFDSLGSFQRAIGGRGSGPGEFESPVTIGRVGDSIWVYDRALARITVFKNSGALARSIRLPVTGEGVLHGNGQVTIHSDRKFGRAASSSDMLRLQSLLPDGRASKPTYPAKYTHLSLAYSVGRRSVVGLQPFDDGPIIARDAGGSGFWFVQQREERGTSTLHIERVDPSWQTLVSREVAFVPVRLTVGIVDRAIDGILAGRGASTDADERRALSGALYRPSTVPSATALVPGLDGSLAIRRETIHADSTRWTRVDRNARIVDEFRLGSSELLLAHQGDRIWILSKTEDQEDEIVVARLEARGRGVRPVPR